jgi:hypothetical protein
MSNKFYLFHFVCGFGRWFVYVSQPLLDLIAGSHAVAPIINSHRQYLNRATCMEVLGIMGGMFEKSLGASIMTSPVVAIGFDESTDLALRQNIVRL